jgi:hypothetical protein
MKTKLDIILNEGVRRYSIERLDESSEIIQRKSSFLLALLTAQNLFRQFNNPRQKMKISIKIFKSVFEIIKNMNPAKMTLSHLI